MSWGPAKRKGGVHRHERRKRQNLCNNNVFSAESSFNAKTSGNQATADHVVPTGGAANIGRLGHLGTPTNTM